jgi:hypothetical protein
MAADRPEDQMLRYLLAGLIVLSATGSVMAQQSPPQAETPAASSPVTTEAKAVTPMEEPLPGDYWTYEVRDEITGNVSAIRTNVVTEVTPTEISLRFTIAGSSDGGFNVYDRSWNLKNSGSWKYQPNDGFGIRTPLAVGKSWAVQCNEINAGNGGSWKRSGNSKVAGQESVTTRAGTFDTFRIETVYTSQNVKDPTRKAEITAQTWYAPAIDHWVKRIFVSRTDKRLRVNNTLELIDYGRKQ